MLSWRLRALYDDKFGRRIDRWFGFAAAAILLCIGLKPAVFGAGLHEPPIGVFSTLMGFYFLFAALFKPGLVSPFSLPLLALAGAIFRIRPGVDRAVEAGRDEAKDKRHKAEPNDLVD